MNKKKIHGQVFTPQHIAVEMLDTLGYTDDNDSILDATVMEPSFGQGVFLRIIMNRIIMAGQRNRLKDQEISDTVDRNMYGIELDPELHTATVNHLKDQAASLGLTVIPSFPHLVNANTLDVDTEYTGIMDYVVGNPPYVRIHNISVDEREKVKSLRFATGNTDLYIAFFELGVNMLSRNGKLAYITPNSFMKNASQRKLREHFVKSGLLRGLTDYRSSEVFDDAATYATITYLENSDTLPSSIRYSLEAREDSFTRSIDYGDMLALGSSPWSLADPQNVMGAQLKKTASISESVSIQNGLCTLKDSVFIDKAPESIDSVTTLFNGYPVESDLLRPVVKSSRYDGSPIKARVILPYTVDDNGRYTPMTDDEMSALYPLAYAYFTAHREALEARDLEPRAVSWFQFGRSQGLKHIDKDKLVMKTSIHPSNKISVHRVPAGTVIYAGVFMVLNDGVAPENIVDTLEAPDFMAYAKVVGKDMNGGFVALSAADIREYRF